MCEIYLGMLYCILIRAKKVGVKFYRSLMRNEIFKQDRQ